MTNFTDDLETWMTNMPPPLKNIPIINLAIPGKNQSLPQINNSLIK